MFLWFSIICTPGFISIQRQVWKRLRTPSFNSFIFNAPPGARYRQAFVPSTQLDAVTCYLATPEFRRKNGGPTAKPFKSIVFRHIFFAGLQRFILGWRGFLSGYPSRWTIIHRQLYRSFWGRWHNAFSRAMWLRFPQQNHWKQMLMSISLTSPTCKIVGKLPIGIRNHHCWTYALTTCSLYRLVLVGTLLQLLG